MKKQKTKNNHSSKRKNRILVIRSGALGDIIMCTPFLKNLRKEYPRSEISFLVGEWSAPVLKNNSDVDKIISFPDEIIAKKMITKILPLVLKLRKQKFDTCFILDKSWMWGLFAKLCGIKERFGFSRDDEGKHNTRSIKFDGSKNEVDYNLELLTLYDIKPKEYRPEIFTRKEDKDYADRFLKKIKQKMTSKSHNKRMIGICPGGAINPGQAALLKRWPIEKYIELTDKTNSTFLIFGGKKDKEVAKKIIRSSKNKNIFDATTSTIQETKELMERCETIISHDSGPMHIASTTKTKLVALFGPTPSKRLCPKNAILIKTKSPPCYTIYGKFENCKEDQMDEISVDEVIKKIRE